MGQRRILVIASQCEALRHLDFLPQVAQDLYGVMTDPDRGGCVPAVAEQGLLVDPTTSDARKAIKDAFRRASVDGATLLFAWIGHGEFTGNDFYLLPRDAELPPDSDSAIHLVHLIKEQHARSGGIDGLAVLLDTCYSGVAAHDATRAWVGELGGTLRFDLLSAAADRPAADGCFSRSLTGLLKEGVASEPSEFLGCAHVRPLIEDRCPNQVPQNPSYNADHQADRGLFLARNVARAPREEPWARTYLADQIERLTFAYQVTPALAELVRLSNAHRCVAVVGDAGTGKSGLAAALAWPRITAGIVPGDFVHALSLITEASSPTGLARELSKQLRKSLGADFEVAIEKFKRETPLDERERITPLIAEVLEPLAHLDPFRPVRFVIDGLDRLAVGMREGVDEFLDLLASHEALAHARLVVTCRPETRIPEPAEEFRLGPTPDAHLQDYLARRQARDVAREPIVAKARGNWLVARLLADFVADEPEADLARLPSDLKEVYDEMLDRALGAEADAARPVLDLLAAGGAGPVLPLALLASALDQLGSPAKPARIRDLLVRLRGLVVRSAAGTDDEHVGLFHQTLVEHIAFRDDGAAAMAAAHRAMVQALASLAPPGQGNPKDPLQRYAAAKEAEHLWALGELDEIMDSLVNRESNSPAMNIQRWRAWTGRLAEEIGADNPYTLLAKAKTAWWSGEAQDNRDVIAELRAALPVFEKEIGPDHAAILMMRATIAQSVGASGDLAGAAAAFAELLPAYERAFGANHPQTLALQANGLRFLGESGRFAEACAGYEALVPKMEEVYGAEDETTLTARMNLATFRIHAVGVREALRDLAALLPLMERVLGPDHSKTLTARNNYVTLTGQAGDYREALRLFDDLLPRLETAFGPDHPTTLIARNVAAITTGQSGDHAGGVAGLQASLPRLEAVVGPDHPEVVSGQSQLAIMRGRLGQVDAALQTLEALLPRLDRVLGAAHVATLVARESAARFTGQLGRYRNAQEKFAVLVPQVEAALGPAHPLTLTAKNGAAFVLGRAGHHAEAIASLAPVLDTMEQVLGKDHAETLTARSHLAYFTGMSTGAQAGERVYEALLPDLDRALGPRHPTTLIARSGHAEAVGRAGGFDSGAALLRELVPQLDQVLGADHEHTRTARHNLALFLGLSGSLAEAIGMYKGTLEKCDEETLRGDASTVTARANHALFVDRSGDAVRAVELYRAVLPDAARVLGEDDPNTRGMRKRLAEMGAAP
jgi:tetratricopeptide (TPR) repeat protein